MSAEIFIQSLKLWLAEGLLEKYCLPYGQSIHYQYLVSHLNIEKAYWMTNHNHIYNKWGGDTIRMIGKLTGRSVIKMVSLKWIQKHDMVLIFNRVTDFQNCLCLPVGNGLM